MSCSTVDNNPFRIDSLPYDVFSTVLGFVEPSEIALFERVCSLWRNRINSEDQGIWIEQCRNQKIPVVRFCIEEIRSYMDTSYCPATNIIDLITHYEGTNYKEESKTSWGKIELYRHSWYIYDQDKNGTLKLLFDRWGNDAIEPFVITKIYKQLDPVCESKQIPKKSGFIKHLPLRLFINSEGDYKNTGDQIKIIFRKKRFILTCMHRLEYFDKRSVNGFKDAIKTRIGVSVALRFTTTDAVNQAKLDGQKSAEWISSD